MRLIVKCSVSRQLHKHTLRLVGSRRLMHGIRWSSLANTGTSRYFHFQRLSHPFRLSSTTSRLAVSEAEWQDARGWLERIGETTIPRSVGDVSYSRSSGPGGQNVNKVNSKAQLRVPLQRLLPLVPPMLHSPIRTSRYFADKTDTLLIQADDSRKQGANKDACFRKLYQMLTDIGREYIPGQTSAEQKERVKVLQTNQNENRLKTKKQLSSRKKARSKVYGE